MRDQRDHVRLEKFGGPPPIGVRLERVVDGVLNPGHYQLRVELLGPL